MYKRINASDYRVAKIILCIMQITKYCKRQCQNWSICHLIN